MDRVTDEQAEEAKRVLYRHYREWVADTANNIVKDFITGETEDIGSTERLDSDVESAMIYTKDQWDTVYSSEISTEAAEDLRENGVDPSSENYLMIWAITTFRMDVQELLGLSEAAQEFEQLRGDADDRIAHLIETHGRLFFRQGGQTAWIIEPIGHGLTQLDLGVLIQKNRKNNFVSLDSVRRGKYHPELSIALEALEEGNSTFIEAE